MMTTETHWFENAAGERLAAELDRPDGRPEAYALFAHCFTCTKDLEAAEQISRALCAQGFAVLRFDFTGLGQSEGRFAETTFTSNVQDLVHAARFLADYEAGPRLLVGHSLGGAAVLLAAEEIASVRAVATIGTPYAPAHVLGLLAESVEEIEAAGAATVQLGGYPFTISKTFVDDVRARRLEAALGRLERALLVLHAPLDRVVGIENAAALFEAARHPKSFVSLDEADHLLSDPADAAYAGAVLAAWARKYVGGAEAAAPAPAVAASEAAPAARRVAVRTGAGFRTEIRARGHRLVADEPRGVGGTDAGPTPYDYLAAALGACTTMTLRMYADRKRWPLEEAVVRLQHEKVHAEDCADCTSAEARIDRIDCEIELIGPLEAAQHARLLEIAARCPVHRTLTGEIDIVTRLKETPG